MKIILLLLMIQLAPNQAISEANREISATLFNEALIIDVVEVKAQAVTAIVHCKGAEDVAINNQRAGYEITVQRYKIRIQAVKESSAVFFVEKSEPVTWGCTIAQPTDKVSDIVTLNCKEKDSDKTFVLDIPKAEWPKEWALWGEQEFYYGTHINGQKFAVRTPPTHCDTRFDRQFGGNRNQDQLCGVMFRKEQQ
jgi:hypothetical protein